MLGLPQLCLQFDGRKGKEESTVSMCISPFNYWTSFIISYSGKGVNRLLEDYFYFSHEIKKLKRDN